MPGLPLLSVSGCSFPTLLTPQGGLAWSTCCSHILASIVWHGQHVALLCLSLWPSMVDMLLSYPCFYSLAWSTCCSHVHDTNSSIVNNLSFVFKLSMSNSLTLHKENVIIFKLFLYNLSISIVEMKYRNISVNKIKVVSRFAMSLH